MNPDHGNTQLNLFPVKKRIDFILKRLMIMIYYCNNCWKEIKANDKTCPFCGSNQNNLEQESFLQKLIRALNHPEPGTPIRAANILGKLNAKEALPALLNRLEKEKDPFIVEAVIDAIIKIEPDKKSEVKKIIGENVPITIKKFLE